MADEAIEETTDNEAPEEASGPETQAPAEETSTEESTPQSDYESRYNDLRPQYDRTMSEKQQLETLIQAAQQGDPQALEALGLEMVEDDADLEDDDEYIDPDERIARLENQLAERDQMTQAERDQAEALDWLAENLDALEQKEGTQLSDDEMEFVVEHATRNLGENDMPDLEASYKALRKVQEDYQKSYVESKKAPRVPAGTAGTEKLDLSTDEKRQAAMAAIMDAEGSD